MAETVEPWTPLLPHPVGIVMNRHSLIRWFAKPHAIGTRLYTDEQLMQYARAYAAASLQAPQESRDV